MTCAFFSQPLNHYDLPRNRSGIYEQRYCYYNGYLANETKYPILLYTGNESPLEMYINQTGLLWEMAVQLRAQVVFLEHRYEGQSLPSASLLPCMAYASSIQALADLARFIPNVLFQASPELVHLHSARPPVHRRPVIAMGGSYGGMLSAWLRLHYPHLVVGAIAASAPILGFPLVTLPTDSAVDTSAVRMDAAWRVIRRGLQQSYPPSATAFDSENHCSTNLLATWPLIRILGSQASGRDLLTRAFRLCQPLGSSSHPTSSSTPTVHQLLDWLASPWFDLAEGSFPYPSSYIPFALIHHTYELPAWPLQAACWTHSQLFAHHGVRIGGNVSNVSYTIAYGDESNDTTIQVEWDVCTGPTNLDALLSSPTVTNLLTSVRDAVAVWYNISQDITCFNVDASAPNQFTTKDEELEVDLAVQRHRNMQDQTTPNDHEAQCAEKIKQGSWASLCCNEEMNLIITNANGLGRDVMWPPSVPRGITTYEQWVDYQRHINALDGPCLDADGIFGYPQDDPDPWSTAYDTVYGGRHISTASNIVFSNGLLDPWSAAGVFSTNPFTGTNSTDLYFRNVSGLMIQNITNQDVLAVIMELGGHHTDLMYSNDADPPCITQARVVEREAIDRWIDQFWTLEGTQ